MRLGYGLGLSSGSSGSGGGGTPADLLAPTVTATTISGTVRTGYTAKLIDETGAVIATGPALTGLVSWTRDGSVLGEFVHLAEYDGAVLVRSGPTVLVAPDYVSTHWTFSEQSDGTNLNGTSLGGQTWAGSTTNMLYYQSGAAYLDSNADGSGYLIEDASIARWRYVVAPSAIINSWTLFAGVAPTTYAGGLEFGLGPSFISITNRATSGVIHTVAGISLAAGSDIEFEYDATAQVIRIYLDSVNQTGVGIDISGIAMGAIFGIRAAASTVPTPLYTDLYTYTAPPGDTITIVSLTADGAPSAYGQVRVNASGISSSTNPLEAAILDTDGTIIASWTDWSSVVAGSWTGDLVLAAGEKDKPVQFVIRDKVNKEVYARQNVVLPYVAAAYSFTSGANVMASFVAGADYLPFTDIVAAMRLYVTDGGVFKEVFSASRLTTSGAAHYRSISDLSPDSDNNPTAFPTGGTYTGSDRIFYALRTIGTPPAWLQGNHDVEFTPGLMLTTGGLGFTFSNVNVGAGTATLTIASTVDTPLIELLGYNSVARTLPPAGTLYLRAKVRGETFANRWNSYAVAYYSSLLKQPADYQAVLRFMDGQFTNRRGEVNTDFNPAVGDNRKPDAQVGNFEFAAQMSVDDMVMLASLCKARPQFQIGDRWSTADKTAFATELATALDTHMPTGVTAKIAFSNEIWNSSSFYQGADLYDRSVISGKSFTAQYAYESAAVFALMDAVSATHFSYVLEWQAVTTTRQVVADMFDELGAFEGRIESFLVGNYASTLGDYNDETFWSTANKALIDPAGANDKPQWLTQFFAATDAAIDDYRDTVWRPVVTALAQEMDARGMATRPGDYEGSWQHMAAVLNVPAGFVTEYNQAIMDALKDARAATAEIRRLTYCEETGGDCCTFLSYFLGGFAAFTSFGVWGDADGISTAATDEPHRTIVRHLAGATLLLFNGLNLDGLFQDHLGTTPVTAYDQSLGLVTDLSGFGQDIVQSTTAARPVIKTDGTLGWAELDGLGQHFVLPFAGGSGPDDLSVVIAFETLDDFFVVFSDTATALYSLIGQNASTTDIGAFPCYVNGVLFEPGVNSRLDILTSISGEGVVWAEIRNQDFQSFTSLNIGKYTSAGWEWPGKIYAIGVKENADAAWFAAVKAEANALVGGVLPDAPPSPYLAAALKVRAAYDAPRTLTLAPSPPTVTLNGTANSTINGRTFAQGGLTPTPSVPDGYSAPMNGDSEWIVSKNPATQIATNMAFAPGNSKLFEYDGQAFDFKMANYVGNSFSIWYSEDGGATWLNASAAPFVPSVSSWVLVDFGSAASRIIEVICEDQLLLTIGFNFEASTTVAAFTDAKPRLMAFGDSYIFGQGTRSDGIAHDQHATIGMTRQIAKSLGVLHIRNHGLRTNGWSNTVSGAQSKFHERIDLPAPADNALSEGISAGPMDVIVIAGSINDNSAAYDATRRTDVSSALSKLRALQPTALIVLPIGAIPPDQNESTAWRDDMMDGFKDVFGTTESEWIANGAYLLDGTRAGASPWVPVGAIGSSALFPATGDTLHPSPAGHAFFGQTYAIDGVLHLVDQIIAL